MVVVKYKKDKVNLLLDWIYHSYATNQEIAEVELIESLFHKEIRRMKK